MIGKIKFKVGERVNLIYCGACYSSLNLDSINTYIRRYKPINVEPNCNSRCDYEYEIISGYTNNDPLSNKELKWKVRFITEYSNRPIYFISSNKNHFLVIEGRGLDKIR